MENDELFKRVEKKTKVDKDTIISLAKKLETTGLKDESTLRDVIRTLSQMTNKEVPIERENKIIDVILKDKVPKNVDKMF